jgi:hypothetical protein
MIRVGTLLLIVVLCGCHSPKAERASATKPNRTGWEQAAQAIRAADTDESQAAAILRFHQLFHRLSDAEPIHSYSWMYFNAEGRMLLPGDSHDDARFVVLYDFENKPTLFLPFLVQIRGTQSRQMLEFPK